MIWRDRLLSAAARGRDRQHRRETERRAATGRAGDGQIAAHQLGQIFDDGETEAGAAVAPRDVRIRLRERTEQPLDLGAGEPNAAVGDGKDKSDTPARSVLRPRFEPDDAALGELHRVVDEVLERRPQPYRVTHEHFR